MVLGVDEVNVPNEPAGGVDKFSLLDSGCTTHIHFTSNELINVRPCDKWVKFGDGRKRNCSWIGDFPTKIPNADGDWVPVLWKNVL
eukprot:2348464-Rhodomonas_salina.1